MKNLIKNWLIKLLDIDDIKDAINQIRKTIYDRDGLDNGFAISKIVEKKTILYGGKQKKVN